MQGNTLATAHSGWIRHCKDVRQLARLRVGDLVEVCKVAEHDANQRQQQPDVDPQGVLGDPALGGEVLRGAAGEAAQANLDHEVVDGDLCPGLVVQTDFRCVW